MKKTRRYPGSRPFEDTPIDRLLFRGRDKEKSELLNLILAYDLVLMYARSGTGKTSLLNAGILQELRKKEYFPATVRFSIENPIESIREAILAETARFDIQVKQVDESSKNLVLLLSKGRFWREDVLLTPVIIFDQFEELFTLHEEAAQTEIVYVLCDLVANRLPDEIEEDTQHIPKVPYKLVVSVREDYLGEMETVAARIPSIMHHRFRLTPLSIEQAKTAIREPAAMEDENFNIPAFTYTDEAIDMLVNFLSKRRERHGYREGHDVEPFQLQIICQHIEDRVSSQPAEPGPIVIEKDDFGGSDGMEKVLEQFYNHQIDQLLEEKREVVHYLCENGLISPTGKRISLEEEYIEETYRVDSETLKMLVELRLLRAEPRVGSTYYELSHDTLVGAVERTGALRRPAILLDQARNSWDNRNYSNAVHYYIQLIKTSPKDWTAYAECAQMLMDFEAFVDAEKILEEAEGNNVSHPTLNIARGQLYLNQNRPEEALTEFEQGLKDDSVLEQAYIGMGQAYLNYPEDAQAAECFRKAFQIDPNLRSAHEGYLKATINLQQFSHVREHAARIRQNDFFIDILPVLVKELLTAKAPIVSREIMEDTLSKEENSIDLVKTIASLAFEIEEWGIATSALEVLSRKDSETGYDRLRGLALQNLEKFDEAEIQFTLVLNKDPSDLESRLSRAICRTMLKRYDEAIEDCKRAVQQDDSSPLPFEYWGWGLSGQEKHEEAIDKFQRADRLKPGDSHLLTLWAGSLISLNQFGEAIKKARDAIKADQTNADAHYELGRAFLFTGRYTEANEKFQTAYEMDPQNANILFSWGVLLGIMRHHNDAIEKFERANRLDPNNVLTLSNWGKSLAESGRYKVSIDKCRQALDIDPESAEAHFNLAQSLNSLGDVHDALDHFQKAVDLDPTDPWILILWANTLIKQAKYSEAEEKYRQAIKLAIDDDTLVSVYNEWGHSLGRMGRHKEAEAQYRKALEIQTSLNLLCSVASELADQGRLEEARKLYLQGEKLGPKDASEFGSLGWGFYQLGDYDKSLHYSRRSLELEPDALYTICNVGLALLRLGRPEEAKKEYELAIRIAERTTDADEFHYHAVGDVEEALQAAPDLPEGREVLESLRGHLARIQDLRMQSRKDPETT